LPPRIGSIGKLFWGGLRLGFARATFPVAVRLARIKATHDLGTPAVDQLLAERLLAAAATTGYVTRRQAELRDRYRVMAEGLRRHLPDWTFAEPSGGLSLWVELPSATAERFASAAARHGVIVGTPESVTVGGRDHRHLRISFNPPVGVIEEATARLGEAWRAEHTARARG
jgi:DNA-binding transcriptional MocR family regulator